MSVNGARAPEAGDLVWLNFDPQARREQSGRRPALVLSPTTYNEKTGLAIVCPITSKIKGYPFEVMLTGLRKIRGAVLCDQIRSLDWRKRQSERIARVNSETQNSVLQKIAILLGIS